MIGLRPIPFSSYQWNDLIERHAIQPIPWGSFQRESEYSGLFASLQKLHAFESATQAVQTVDSASVDAGSMSVQVEGASLFRSRPHNLLAGDIGGYPRRAFGSGRRTGERAVFLRADSYFHFLLEELPILLRSLQEVRGLPVLLTGKPSSWHTQLLATLGIKALNLRHGTAQTDLAFIPRPLSSGFPRLSEISLVQRSFSGAKSLSHAKTLKVYVSRRRSSRSLQGEVELERALESTGWIILHSQEENITVQQDLFSSAHYICGPHGAGLANLIWCQPGTTVLELTRRNYHHVCFAYLAEQLHLNYQSFNVDGMSARAIAEEVGKT